MFDLISIGDCVIDTFVPLEQAELLVDPKTHQQMLGLAYGTKVPVEQSESFVGGNAANNAIGASRLGLKTAIYTNIGNKDDDEADDRIKNKLKKERVSLQFVIETDELASGHHVVLTYKGERTILSHHPAWRYDLPDLDSCKWIYLTSMAPSYFQSPILEQIANFLDRSNAKLAYQPGSYQVRNGPKRMGRILAASQFLIMNLEEAKIFLGLKESEEISIKKLLTKLADLGPKNVVITDGKEGAYGFDGEYYCKLGVFPAKLVEMTGTGDAFATGTLAGLFHGKDLPEAMRWGAANSASVVEHVGSTTGLLSHRALQQKLKQHSKIQAKEF